MESQRAVPVLRSRGRKVVDLSADYRLRDASLYATWYKAGHVDADGLKAAVYGMPELHRKEIASASFVASPGLLPDGRGARDRAAAGARVGPSRTGS